MSNNQNDFQSAFSAGAEQDIVRQDIHGTTHVLLPESCSLKSMEHLMPSPSRIKASPEFNDIEGFADYTEEFSEPGSRIFVSEGIHRFETVFDCHHKDNPAWGEHRASLTMPLSDEWGRLVRLSEEAMSMQKFSEFVEDHLAYIAGTEDSGLSAADVMSMAQSYKVKLRGNVDVEDRVDNGLRKLVFKDDSTVHGSNINGKEVIFPNKLVFKMPVFKNHHTYAIEVYLRQRIKDDRTPQFWFKIPDYKKTEEIAFDNIIDEVRKTTKLKVLKGSL